MEREDVKLSTPDRKLLINLCRNEARGIGYGTKYSYENRSMWPPRLKQMQSIIRKLQAPDTGL
jgi:hypothetical protein